MLIFFNFSVLDLNSLIISPRTIQEVHFLGRDGGDKAKRAKVGWLISGVKNFGNWYLPLYITLIYLSSWISLQYSWYLSRFGQTHKIYEIFRKTDLWSVSGSELHLPSLISVNFRACTRSRKKKWVERTQKDSFIFRSKTHWAEQPSALCTNPGVGSSRSGGSTDNTEIADGLTFGGKCAPYKISKCHSNNDCKLCLKFDPSHSFITVISSSANKIRPFRPYIWILTPSLIKIFVVGIVKKVAGERAMKFWNMVL